MARVANTQSATYTPNLGSLGLTTFHGVNQPTAFFPTPAGTDYQVNLNSVAAAARSQTFQNTLNAWNQGLGQADRWTITYANAGDSPANLTFLVNSYEAYGNPFFAWISSGSNAKVSGGIDVRTNLPFQVGDPQYRWINVYTTNFDPPRRPMEPPSQKSTCR